MEEILKKIVDKKIERIREKGCNFGRKIPEKRDVPLNIPDFEKGTIICEVKRGSPSEGKMRDIDDPVSWVSNYVAGGADTVSVLTEEDFFLGSLEDLIKIKKEFPDKSILRKDFLIYEEEIEISYKAGADLVLLIAAILDYDTLKVMKEKAESFGMVPLIEIHNEDELKKIISLKPGLIGINSRDLKTFKLNKNYPCALNQLIKEANLKDNFKSEVIFESGIKGFIDSFFVGLSSFNGILVGTSIVKSDNISEQVSAIKEGFNKGQVYKSDFYNKIFKFAS
ncbi:MAG TPA: indole-3-glycerol-phosphate synthase [Spirochaetota bacterium]|nr:indole-3-glycerol-phosphate synthase [Spirochaetota bacterium]